MSIQDIIEGKKEWRAHVARVKALPKDYQIVYKEIQKYLFKVGPVELTEGIGLLSGIIDLFEEGASLGKGVLEVTGSDVAAFCDGSVLILIFAAFPALSQFSVCTDRDNAQSRPYFCRKPACNVNR